MPNKILIAITGASGAIYAKLLLDKLALLTHQWQELSIVMSNNAKDIWKTELGDESYDNYPARYFDKYDFNAPFASGSGWHHGWVAQPGAPNNGSILPAVYDGTTEAYVISLAADLLGQVPIDVRRACKVQDGVVGSGNAARVRHAPTMRFSAPTRPARRSALELPTTPSRA